MLHGAGYHRGKKFARSSGPSQTPGSPSSGDPNHLAAPPAPGRQSRLPPPAVETVGGVRGAGQPPPLPIPALGVLEKGALNPVRTQSYSPLRSSARPGLGALQPHASRIAPSAWFMNYLNPVSGHHRGCWVKARPAAPPRVG